MSESMPSTTSDAAAAPVNERVGKSEPPAPLSVHQGTPAAQWPPRVLGDLMTRQIIALREDETLGKLEASMQRFRFRHLPVVGEAGKLVGLISRTDYLHAALGTGPDGQPLAEKVDEDTRAGAIMRRGVVTGRATTSIEEACRVMLQEKLACLPVVADDSTLIGIVTETDFVKLTLALIERNKATS